MNKYAVSDIHGCLKTFKALLTKLDFSKQDELYLLGDYIDRGPDSKGVIDYIWHLQDQGYQVACIRGNHEQMLLDCVNHEDKFLLWEYNGGDTTMLSFGGRHLSAIPAPYLTWLAALPYYLEVDQYILVHAGFKFDMPNPFDEKQAMIWQRDWYDRIDYHWLGDRIIIHGHTPLSQVGIQDMVKHVKRRPVIDIDNGCVFWARHSGMGRLCALELNTHQLHFQKYID